MAQKVEIAAAVIGVIGLILGTVLGFLLTQGDKALERGREKKKAIMCLKIELRKIKPEIDAFIRMQSTLGSSLPATDIYEPNMATQVSQFIYFDEPLAEQIYNLSTCLRKTLTNTDK